MKMTRQQFKREEKKAKKYLASCTIGLQEVMPFDLLDNLPGMLPGTGVFLGEYLGELEGRGYWMVATVPGYGRSVMSAQYALGIIKIMAEVGLDPEDLFDQTAEAIETGRYKSGQKFTVFLDGHNRNN